MKTLAQRVALPLGGADGCTSVEVAMAKRQLWLGRDGGKGRHALKGRATLHEPRKGFS